MKPRIYRKPFGLQQLGYGSEAVWVCGTEKYTQRGSTPAEAYRRWARMYAWLG